MKATELFGYVIIGNAIVMLAWWLATNKPNIVYAGPLCLLAVFVGLVCILNERVTEITISKVGSIKTAAKQVVGDAKEVAELKKRVEGQAATVDLVAQKATEAERIARELSAKNEEASKKLQETEDKLHKASKALDDVNELATFMSTALAAQTEDRKAFDQLAAWAKDDDYRFHKRAEEAYAVIFNASATPWEVSYSVNWSPGIEPGKLTLEVLRDEVARVTVKEEKYGLLQFIAGRQDIPLKDRLEYFASLLRDNPDLGVVRIAGQSFAKLSTLKIKPLATEFLLTWWAENGKKNDSDILKAAEHVNAKNYPSPTPAPASPPAATPAQSPTPSASPAG